MMAPDTAATAEAVEAVDARVLAKRDDLCAFEKSFNKVRPPAAATSFPGYPPRCSNIRTTPTAAS